jgi:hypothetical protein
MLSLVQETYGHLQTTIIGLLKLTRIGIVPNQIDSAPSFIELSRRSSGIDLLQSSHPSIYYIGSNPLVIHFQAENNKFGRILAVPVDYRIRESL